MSNADDKLKWLLRAVYEQELSEIASQHHQPPVVEPIERGRPVREVKNQGVPRKQWNRLSPWVKATWRIMAVGGSPGCCPLVGQLERDDSFPLSGRIQFFKHPDSHSWQLRLLFPYDDNKDAPNDFDSYRNTCIDLKLGGNKGCAHTVRLRITDVGDGDLASVWQELKQDVLPHGLEEEVRQGFWISVRFSDANPIESARAGSDVDE